MMAVNQDGQEQLTVRHPKKRSMRFFKFNRNDWAWTIISAMVVYVAAALIGSTLNRGFVLLALIVWCLTMLPVEQLNDRVYFGPIAFIDNLRIKLFSNYTWRAGARGVLGMRRRNRIMRLAVQGFGDVGLIYNRRRDTYSMVLKADGSPISSQNIRVQFASHEQIATIFIKAATAAGVKIQVSTGVRARPEDPWVFWNMLAIYGEVEVATTEAEAENRAIEDYSDYDHRMKYLQTVQLAQEEISEMSNDTEMVMVITIAGTEAFRRAVKKKSITEEEFSRQPISRVKTAVLPLLEKVTDGVVTVFDSEGAERYLRSSYDVANLREYHDHAHERALKGSEIKPDQWFPRQYIKQFKTYVQIDDTFGATLKVTSYPRADSFPFEARVFYAAHARYFANSVIGETQHGRWSYNFLNLGSGFVGDVVAKVGIDVSGPRADRRDLELNERLKEIDDSVYIQDYCPLVAVSGFSLEDLEMNIEMEMDRLNAEGMQTVRVIGERNQLNWYLTATTMIDLT